MNGVVRCRVKVEKGYFFYLKWLGIIILKARKVIEVLKLWTVILISFGVPSSVSDNYKKV